MGLDVIKAHGICCVVAQVLGGIVFPAHYYSGIHAMTEQEINKYTGQWGNIYTDTTAQSHLADIINQLELTGIKKLVIYTGHYPSAQEKMVRSLTNEYQAKPNGIRVFAPLENEILESGDHAGIIETSLLLYLDRRRVKMNAIGPENYHDHGWEGPHDPEQASVALGETYMMAIINAIKELLSE